MSLFAAHPAVILSNMSEFSSSLTIMAKEVKVIFFVFFTLVVALTSTTFHNFCTNKPAAQAAGADPEFLKAATMRPYGRAKFFRDCARFEFLAKKCTIYHCFTFFG